MSSSVKALKNEFERQKLRAAQWLMSKVDPAKAIEREPPAFLKSAVQQQQNYFVSAAFGAMSFELLRTSYNVGIFKLLHEKPGLTLQEIARSLGLDAYPVEILLLGLVPLNLAHKVGDQYYNNPFLSYALAGALNNGAVGNLLAFFHEVINPAIAHLQESVTQKKPVGLQKLFGDDAKSFYEAMSKSDHYSRLFDMAMRADEQSIRARARAGDIFARHRRILDIGGNTGELAIAIAEQYPEARITVFDFPDVAVRAQQRFHELGLADRIDTVGGNVLHDEFPEGYDCIVFSHFLDIFSPKKVRDLLGRAYRSLPSGGTVCVFGLVVDDDETGPLTHCVLSAYFLALADGEGRFYTARQTAAAMVDVGLHNPTVRRLPRNEALVLGEKP
jgi:ubiquinone/menaquinone biosynthesis C-methylase UbiE